MPLFTGFGLRAHRPRPHRPASRRGHRASTPGLLGERLESRQLLAADMIAVAAGTLPTTSFLAGTQVSAFQIAKYEVTWSDWQEVRTWSAAEGRTYDLGSIGTGAAASNPVESVSWYDAVKWCNAKSEKDGLQPVYTANGSVYRSGEFGVDGTGTVLADSAKNGYRLPARAEWEWAARGGASSKGFSYSGGNTLSDVAWYQGNADGGTKAVGTKAANELGIYDMSGNAAEWCWNEFTNSPTSLGSFSYMNGGSWADNEFGCSFDSPGLELDATLRLPGLRLARSATVVNNTPTGISLSATSIAENNAVGATIGTLTTTDPDAGDTFTYTLVSGTGSTDNASFTIASGALKANIGFNFEAKPGYSIRIRSTDQSGLSTEKAFTITVTNVNEAPTATVPASFTVTEDVAGNLVWPASPVAFADVDSPSLTVTLAVANGTLTAKPAAGITLDGPATARMFIGTPAALNGYFKTAGNIQYTTAANNTVARTLTTTVSDGMLSSSKTSTISITPVNDAPTVKAPASFAVSEDVASNLVWPASPAAFADVDSTSLTVTLAVSTGTLTLAEATGIKLGVATSGGMTQTGRTVTGTTAALNSYFKTAGNVRYTTAADDTSDASLLVGVSDGALSAAAFCTIVVKPVNDAPTVTVPTTFTVLKNVASNLVWPADGPDPVGDIDSESLTVTLAVADGTLAAKPGTGIAIGGTATALTLTGAAGDLNAYLRFPGNVQYTTKLDNTAARTLTTTVSDGTLPASKTSTISINAFAPTATVPASFTVTEDVAGNLVWPASPVAFADVDSPSLTVTLAVANGTITAKPAAGITLDGPATARMFIGTPAALNGYFMTAGNIQYTTAANNTVARTLTTTVSDGMLSSSKTSTIKVTPVNDAPKATVPASFTVAEDVAGNLVWPASPAAFADVDSPSLLVRLAVADGTLTAATGGGVTVGGTATSRTFAGTAAALNAYFKTAGSIRYTTAANNTISRTLTTTVSDGLLTATKTSTISITPVNDAPTVTAPASFTVTEDVAGNLAWPASPVAFADVDTPSLTVTLAVTDGTLTAAPAAGVTLDGTATSRTFAGTAAALNTYFKTAGSITYTTAANNTVSRTLTTTVSDGTLTASKTSTISITPVNDAPTVTVWNAFGFSGRNKSAVSISEEPLGGQGLEEKGVLLAPSWTFADTEGDLLTATFTIDSRYGSLSVRRLTAQEQVLKGVTVNGSTAGSTLSFTGKAAALDAFFRDGNNVYYTDTVGSSVAKFRLLTASLSDGKTSSSVATWITIQ